MSYWPEAASLILSITLIYIHQSPYNPRIVSIIFAEKCFKQINLKVKMIFNQFLKIYIYLYNLYLVAFFFLKKFLFWHETPWCKYTHHPFKKTSQVI